MLWIRSGHPLYNNIRILRACESIQVCRWGNVQCMTAAIIVAYFIIWRFFQFFFHLINIYIETKIRIFYNNTKEKVSSDKTISDRSIQVFSIISHSNFGLFPWHNFAYHLIDKEKRVNIPLRNYDENKIDHIWKQCIVLVLTFTIPILFHFAL